MYKICTKYLYTKGISCCTNLLLTTNKPLIRQRLYKNNHSKICSFMNPEDLLLES